MSRILLGVSGGIAAYKALELTRLAQRAGHAVRVVMTGSATRFVGPASFAGITGAPVLVTEWEPDPLRGAFPGDPLPEHAPLSHLALVERADAYVIAPASAHTLAKLAHGHADNLLTAAALACRRPLVIAPAMNAAMYEHPATQANVALLRERGAVVLDPGTGALGSPGEWGVGRLPEPAELLAAVEARLGGGRADGTGWAGRHVLVTAGGTREPIDAVRFVGNRSSGRMGFALAEEAARRGAAVTVVAANVALPRRPGIDYVDVGTAAELLAACEARFPAADVLVMAAAVADYAPERAHGGKLKKGEVGDRLELSLVRTPDVLAGLSAARRPEQLLVGFAAEHGAGARAYGREKLLAKGLDAVVVNDVGAPGVGFDAAENEVWILTAEGERHVARASKPAVAAAVLDEVLKLSSQSESKVHR
jgi:phosphopantothenoylcysteine decarboxylase / phosphopantothenate---cysteine ligase